jgi:hypothetical protein
MSPVFTSTSTQLDTTPTFHKKSQLIAFSDRATEPLHMVTHLLYLAFFLSLIIISCSISVYACFFAEQLTTRSIPPLYFPLVCRFSSSLLLPVSVYSSHFVLALISYAVYFHPSLASLSDFLFLLLLSLPVKLVYSLPCSTPSLTDKLCKIQSLRCLSQIFKRISCIIWSMTSTNFHLLFPSIRMGNILAFFFLCFSSSLSVPTAAAEQLEPSVFSLYPSLGPVIGGTSVYLTGSNLNANGTYCKFTDSEQRYSLVLGTDPTSTSVTCKTPPNTIGYNIVEVTVDHAASFSTSKVAFLYTGQSLLFGFTDSCCYNQLFRSR